MISRRALGRILFAGLGLAIARRKASSAAIETGTAVDRLLANAGLPLPDPSSRSYRADVVVTVLGIPIFARKGVGSACAAIRETIAGDRRLVALRFAGGSNSQRTRGLKYDGSIEEAVFENASIIRQAAYFGFLTSSRNESYDQARERIFAQQKPAESFVAAEGLHLAGCARFERSLISLPDESSRESSDLNRDIRARFCNAAHTAAEIRTPAPGAAATFLYSVLEAMRSGSAKSSLDYVHNAKSYRLEWERARESRRGAASAANRQTALADPATRFSGRIHDLSTRQISNFHLWLDDESGLPHRIEFQPRSYLRITLEHDPALGNDHRKEET